MRLRAGDAHDPSDRTLIRALIRDVRAHFDGRGISGPMALRLADACEMLLKVLDPVGNVVELWDLVGVFPTEINFGDLTYEDGSPVEISATLRFDQAILQF
jgi:hypothetical protein